MQPPSRSSAATADDANAQRFSPLSFINLRIAVVTNVFPVPAGAPRKKRR